MKRQFTYLVLTAGLSAILGSTTVSAQEQTEVANIPFEFHANTSTLPAGRYTVSRSSRTGVTQLRDQTGRGIFVTTIGADTSEVNNPRLTFTCYGEDCTLSKIWLPDGLGVGVTSHKGLTRRMDMAANIRSVGLTQR